MRQLLYYTAGAAFGICRGAWLVVTSRDLPTSAAQVSNETVHPLSPCYSNFQTAVHPASAAMASLVSATLTAVRGNSTTWCSRHRFG